MQLPLRYGRNGCRWSKRRPGSYRCSHTHGWVEGEMYFGRRAQDRVANNLWLHSSTAPIVHFYSTRGVTYGWVWTDIIKNFTIFMQIKRVHQLHWVDRVMPQPNMLQIGLVDWKVETSCGHRAVTCTCHSKNCSKIINYLFLDAWV